MSNTDDRHSSIFPTQGDETHHGLSKLDYFAARAPKDIPEWFQHKQREKPPRESFSIDDNEWQMYWTWNSRPSAEKPNDDCIARIKKYNDAIREWQQQDMIDRAVQWPWFWAQAVLDQQERRDQEEEFVQNRDYTGIWGCHGVKIRVEIDAPTMNSEEIQEMWEGLYAYWATKNPSR